MSNFYPTPTLWGEHSGISKRPLTVCMLFRILCRTQQGQPTQMTHLRRDYHDTLVAYIF